jgi:hypothetical protein
MSLPPTDDFDPRPTSELHDVASLKQRARELEEYNDQLQQCLADDPKPWLRIPVFAYVYKVRPQIPHWWGWRYSVVYLAIDWHRSSAGIGLRRWRART